MPGDQKAGNPVAAGSGEDELTPVSGLGFSTLLRLLRLAVPDSRDYRNTWLTILTFSVLEVVKYALDELVFVNYIRFFDAVDRGSWEDMWLSCVGFLWKLLFEVVDVTIMTMKHRLRCYLQINLGQAITRKYVEGDCPGSQLFYAMQQQQSPHSPLRMEQHLLSDMRQAVNCFINTSVAIYALIKFINTVYRLSLFPGYMQRALLYTLIMGVISSITAKADAANEVQVFLADLRAKGALIRVQEYAESIAFCQGGNYELQHFEHLVENSNRKKQKQFWVTGVLGIFQHIVSWIAFLPIYLHVKDSVISGVLTIAQATEGMDRSGVAFETLGTLSTVFKIVYGGKFAAERLDKLIRSANRLSCTETLASGLSIQHQVAVKPNTQGPCLELCDVTLHLPTPAPGLCDRLLLDGLSLKIADGERLLIQGGSGLGKSALLTALRGLWMGRSSGEVRVRSGPRIRLVPQRPYMCWGTLREQLLYPEAEASPGVTDEVLRTAISDARLGPVLCNTELDEVKPWGELLSGGQLQRLAMARVLARRDPHPAILLLDEATASMDLNNEAHIYSVLEKRFPCYVSVSNRTSLRQYHTFILNLEHASNEDSSSHGPSTKFHLSQLEGDPQRSPCMTPDQRRLDVPSKQVANDSSRSGPRNVGPEWAQTVVEPAEYRGGIIAYLTNVSKLVLNLMRSMEKGKVYAIIAGVLMVIAAAYVSSRCSRFSMEVAGNIHSAVRLKDESLMWSIVWQNWWRPVVSMSLGFGQSALVFYLGLWATCFATLQFAGSYLNKEYSPFYGVMLGGAVTDPQERIVGDIVTVYGQLLQSAFLGLLFFFVSLWPLVFQYAKYSPWGSMFQLFGWVFFSCIRHRVFATKSAQAQENITQTDAKLSHACVRLREHADMAASLGGGDAELKRLMSMIALNANTVRKGWMMNLHVGLANWIIISSFDAILRVDSAVLLLNRKLSWAEFQTSQKLMTEVADLLAKFFDALIQICRQCVWVSRVQELAEEVATCMAKDRRAGGPGSIKMEDAEMATCALSLEELTLRTPITKRQPNSTILLQSVSGMLHAGESMLICGESGIGKSSLLRSIAGLWNVGSGAIKRPKGGAVFFLPQRSYACAGTLRKQLLYPQGPETAGVGDAEISAVLKMVGLDRLLQEPGLGPLEGASEETGLLAANLSAGELQRFGFARMLLTEGVSLVLLDEATSGLDVDGEARMYEFLRERMQLHGGPNGGSYVSVAHNVSLHQQHSHVLHLMREDSTQKGAAQGRILPMAEYKAVLNASSTSSR